MSFGRTKLIIDWHNYGFTILQANNRHRSLVRVGKMYETILGSFGDKHLTVSEAMRNNLVQTTSIRR
jgi:beta-1,4-mannosyltransferase